jgi:hypothetical protein
MYSIKRRIYSHSLQALLVFACMVCAQSLVFPPYLHSYGIRKATQANLFMFFGPITSFTDPQGLATAKMITRDDPTTEKDDDEVVVYGVNSGRHQLIYNTSMYSLALYGSKGGGKDQFLFPKGVACDPLGNVYVADSGNNRIVHLFNPKTKVQWVSAFSGGSSEDAGLNGPTQVALDEKGHIYVADAGNRRIVIFDKAGTVRCIIPGPKTQMVFVDAPTGLAVADGTAPWSYFLREQAVFCADSGGRRLWKFDFEGKLIRTVSLPPKHSAFYGAVDYYHNLYLTDKCNHCILKYDHDLALVDIFGSQGTGDNQFVEPRGIAIFKRYGQVFIAEKTGAQYYWIGTQLKDRSLHIDNGDLHCMLSTRLTEYGYVTLFSVIDVDTTFYFKKRFVREGEQATDCFIAPDCRPQARFEVRVEPTYSSYTYFWKYYPVPVRR